MSKFLQRVLVCGAMILLPLVMSAQQLPNASFEDWSGEKFDGEIQPKSWNASNVEQLSFKFNFAHREAGHTGDYSMMVQDQDVGAAGITETSPGYFSLGKPWVYLESITKISEATAGTAGGVSWKYRPDSMSVWIKRTGSDSDKEDFYLLYYAWSGTAVGNKFKGKNGKCTSVTKEDEESDVRYELNGNECGTSTKANQIAEGMWRERKQYSNWTKITVPIFYFNNDVPTKMNIIFSASNYPNYRANSGLYSGNSLYVDDVELIYSSKIQKLYIGGKEWKGFDPNSTDVQTYSLGETATSIPEITARRGAGAITNARGKTVTFTGRMLQGSECVISYGDLESKVTTITVKSEDGKSTTVYQIQFQRAPSSNATLAEITVNGEPLEGFRPGQMNYNVELPYGTTQAPVVGYTPAEDGQTVSVTQASSPTGTSTIAVTAPDGTTKMTYKLQFSIGKLKDVTLEDIKVNGKSITGFTPSQAVYKVSLPVGTPSLTIEPVSAYPKGEQTITITPNPLPTGDAIHGTTVQIVVSAPGATSPKTYKLNIKIEESSYSYLADLKVVGNQIADVNPSKLDDPKALAFSPDVTTYYVNLVMGTKTLPQILYTPGDDYQTIDTTGLNGAVDGTFRISVLAGNKSDQTVYKLVFLTEKSVISTLAGINIAGVPLEGFAPDKTNYFYELPIGTTELPEITPIANDEFQEIVVSQGGVNGKTRISVTAGDGTTTNYYITFSVKKYDDNTLKSLSVGPGYYLQNEYYEPVPFDPQRNDYWVKLTKDSLPTIRYELQSKEYQDTVVIYPTSSNGKYKITVRPRNGVSRTYTIQFVYKKSDNTALKMIYIADTIKGDTVAMPDFLPETTDYTFTLDTGTTVMPEVLYEASEASQVITQAWDANNKRVHRITVLAESGAKRTYKIKFLVPSAASTQLDSILLVEGNDTTLLKGFKKDVYEYTYQFEGETCPLILVKQGAEDQQVTITAPYGAGQAVILVKMEESSSQYTIDFVKKPAATVQLSDIRYDGKSVAGFVPTTLQYEVTLEGNALPATVEGVGEGMKIKVVWKDNTAYLNVQDAAGNKAVYTVVFSRTLSNDNTLEGIYADDALIKDFDKTKLDYTFDLAAGSTYPAITYKASKNAQVVFFGQLKDGKWGITVVAGNGDEKTYTVQYNIAKYSDATLKSMSLEGYDLTPTFAPTLTAYAVTIDEGAALPQLNIEAREGQTILQSNVNDSLQKVVVYAESGATMTYSVKYHRTYSSNALLKDILIDGVSLEGFDPNKTKYVDSLDRKALFVPNVFPIGQLNNQTITTYFSRPNGVTKILVVAQDGTEKEYTIEFPVRKSKNTFLSDEFYLDPEEADIKFNPNVTDYEIILPYKATECPKMIYAKADDAQRIDVISRPIGQTSQIIVTAENGDTRTYSFLFKREVLKTKNVLAAIHIVEPDKDLNLKNKDQRIFDVTLPYNARSLTVQYEKTYPEQTVFIYPGGVNDTTYIVVKANNDTVADEIYKLNPVVTTQNPAILTDLKVNGVTIDGFDSNRFTYLVNVTARPKITYTKDSKVAIEYEQTDKVWECVVESEDGFVNKYRVICYYTNDIIPNNEFKEWTTPKYNASRGAVKPTYWQVPADADDKKTVLSTAYTGDEIQKSGTEEVYFKTTYWSALKSAIPAIMTLGKVTGSLAVDAGTNMNFSGSIGFRNTPDQVQIRYKYAKMRGDGALFAFRFFDDDGAEYNRDTVITEENSSYKTITKNLTTDGILVKQMNIAVNATNEVTNCTPNSILSSTSAELYLDWIKYLYNSTPKAAKVNGINATLSSKVFTVTLTDPEDVNIRSYEFNGQVSDQAQLLTWGTPKKDANFETRTATVRNFAEDGSYTDGYSLVVKRPLDTNSLLKALLIGGDTLKTFKPNDENYTVSIKSSQRNLPDVQPVPGSSLQTVTTSYNEADSTMTISVKPEKGTAKTYKVKFVTSLSNDVTLQSLKADDKPLDIKQTSFDVAAAYMPLITFEKQSDLQTVVLNNGTLTVTAEDGKTTGTYTIHRVDTVITQNGTISEFEINGNVVDVFGGDAIEKTAVKPTDYIDFSRAKATDSVIFIQAPDKMTWTVPTKKTYTWTYPTEASSNAFLQMITMNGTNYDEFDKYMEEYDLTSDSTLAFTAIGADDKQSIEMSYAPVQGGVLYTALVTAEDGTTKKTYKIRVVRPMSGIATLNGILLDSVLIDEFDPDKQVYTYTLAAPAGAKKEQPKMPNITYVAGHPGQTVKVTPGVLDGEATQFEVTGEDGALTTTYTLTVKAEPSHCSDLTGITVNGEAIDFFEPGRHYYSVSVKTDAIELDYMADDRFQTVETHIGVSKDKHQYSDTLRVIAEDGISVSDYIVEIYVENQSNDAQLANILLNNKPMDRFEPLYNSDIVFDGGNNNYEINLPITGKLPEVSAQLKMDGQKVEIEHRRDEALNTDSILLHVTAVDDTTSNTYILHFVRPMSTNSQLGMIEINNVPIEGFDPNIYFYAYDMSSDEETPRISVETADEFAHADDPDFSQEGRATITVYAQDYQYDKNHKSIYTIAINVKKSEVATLDMIYQGRDSLPGFQPTTFYYAYELGAHESFPDLNWQDPDNYPKVSPIDTVEYDPIAQKLVRQIKVTAEDTTVSNTYTIAYTIKKSDIDTLQMIFVGSKPLPGFKADVLEYEYKLTAAEVVALEGELPEIDPIPGEEDKQKIETLQVRDNYGVKTVGYKHVVTVTAAAGNSRTYTIHYPRELSDDATLKMIFIDESPLPNFDAERNSYKVELDYGVPVPNVTEATKEYQTVKHNQHGDTVEVIVTAEMETVVNTYTIVFERRKSSITTLRNLILLDEQGKQLPYDRFAFQSKQFDYTVVMPYVPGDTTYALPQIAVEFEDPLQDTVVTVEVLKKTEKILTIRVIAPNKEDEAEYKLLFDFLRNDDALLQMINVAVNDSTVAPLKNFKSDTYNYTYVHPYGTDSAEFINATNVQQIISYVKNDSLATDTMYIEANGTIRIIVTAQDEKTQSTYSIRQIIGKDTVNLLKMIYLDGVEYDAFKPEENFYVYMLRNGSGSCPTVTAKPMSENAEISITEMPVNDTTIIFCTAQDGTDRIYRILFLESTVNDGIAASEKDVFIRRVPGSYQFFVATIRKDVTFVMYDQNGRMIYFEMIPDAEPNAINVAQDAFNKDVLLGVDVDPNSGILVDIEPGQTYFYSFIKGGKKIITSGKIMAL